MKKISAYSIGLALIFLGMFSFGFNANAQTLAAGCTSTAGYSTTTGATCNGSTTIPQGCTAATGYSTTTGYPCNGSTISNNGGIQYPLGCSTYNGTSSVTNYPCNGEMGVSSTGTYYNVPGCSSTTGYSPISGL